MRNALGTAIVKLIDATDGGTEPAYKHFTEQASGVAQTCRILFRGMRELIHEAFDHKNIVSRSDAAPESRRDTRGLDTDIVDVDVRQRIRRLGRRFYGIEV
ncbi:hypothetical protein SAMN05519103_08891 [Rhizobiales bacterium GAS113]|nr:hypothetical protein SAMN05519103_08891 [Rhizobiales bacterium GAS113]